MDVATVVYEEVSERVLIIVCLSVGSCVYNSYCTNMDSCACACLCG